MEVRLPADDVLRVGDWTVEPATMELRRDGEAVRIEPKAMDVLLVLVQQAGHVVSREEFFAAVWPQVVVGDEALTQSIIKLRRALRDNARRPAYIETIAKRGYRLIAPVSRTMHEDAAAGSRPLPRPHVRWTARLVAGSVLCAALLGLCVFLPSGSHETSDPRFAPVTVTVAPFQPLGGDQAYLASGLADSLATDLSRLSGLRVIRSQSGVQNGTAPDARYRVSGTVQREGALLRINIHLVEVATNEQLWTERFERPFGELFAIQDEIVGKLVGVLPGKVADVEHVRQARRYTRSVAAYDYFLRGQALFLVREDDANDEAQAMYRKAVELDPKFARAYAGLAMTYAMDARLRPSPDANPGLDRALELAKTACQIDPEAPEVHWALGFVYAQSRRHEEAIDALRRAIALDPAFADAYALMGGLKTYVGQPAQSIPLLRTAMRLNPDGGYLYFLLLGRAYLFENDIDQALINLRAALLRNPSDVETHVYLAAALVAAGDNVAATWETHEIRSLEPGFSTRDWLQSYPLRDTRERDRLASLLTDAKL